MFWRRRVIRRRRWLGGGGSILLLGLAVILFLVLCRMVWLLR